MIAYVNSEQSCKGAPFRFRNIWTSDPKFDTLVREVWSEQLRGCAMFVFQQLNKTKYDDLQLRVNQARTALKKVQEELGVDQFNSTLLYQEKSAIENFRSL